MRELPLKPENSRFTDDQWQAVYDAGTNLLVSASAGSGKTTVLVERVIEKVKAGTNVDELLIVTYTDAAAREMKERIQSALQKAITGESLISQKRHLVKQIPMLSQASISTIHSFCLQVIRRYYYLIDLDPVFRLLTDSTEIVLLQEDVWNDVREELYGEEDSLFKTLTSTYSNDRTDSGLQDLVFSLFEFSRANPNPELWLEHLGDLYEVDEASFTTSTLFTDLLKPQIREILVGLEEQYNYAISIGENSDDLIANKELLEAEGNHIAELLRLLNEGNVEAIYQSMRSFEFARWKSPKKNTDEEIKEVAQDMKSIRDQNKKRYQTMKDEYFAAPLADQIELMHKTVPLIKEMSRVTQLFSTAYTARKRERNLLDFNDLEHLTLNILAQFDEGTWTPTEASMHYREKFKEVMVDEYQDVNQLQENILYWLTQQETDHGNFFMVGDVKQSIYSFRLADPGLFLKKYESYGNNQDGERIILADNFRSRGEVLQFINLLFIQLMDKSVGQMEYDEAAKLVQGFTDFPASQTHQPEILIFEKETEDETELEEEMDEFGIETKTEGELMMVGQKIKSLIDEGFPIYDKKNKTHRPIQYSDIVLLTPTKKNNATVQALFKQLGIPLLVNDTQNYFQTTEVTIMMSLLKVIDNPYQDIPLASVLRSPLVGLNEREMAYIRITKKTGDYYDAVLTFYREYPGTTKETSFTDRLYEKIGLFLERMNTWREIARRGSIVTLIWSIYQETDFLDYVGGMASGRQRKANLHALYERAASYEQTSFKGLFQFVRFIEKMQQKDKDLAEPTALSEDENAVRIMTIHASKGLEFPVVFVLDLTKRFNLQDTMNSYVFNEHLGVGTEYKDLQKRVRFTTLPETVLKVEKKKKLLAEEMRKLYVALTRAEEKLYLVGSYKNEEAAWKDWGVVSSHQQTVLPSDLRLTANSLMKWIGLAIVRHPNSQNDFLHITAKNGEVQKHPASFSVHFTNEKELLQQNEALEVDFDAVKWLEQLEAAPVLELSDPLHQEFKEVKRLLEHKYAHQAATHTTSYQSVSEIKRMFEEPHEGQLAKIDISQPRNQNRYTEDKLRRPTFLTETTAPTSVEIGTATHLVLQSIDLHQTPTLESVRTLIAELIERGLLQEETAKRIEAEKIVAFFTTPVGELIVKDAEYVKREKVFSLLMSASSIFSDMDDSVKDKVLIHGIIDGYIEYSDYVVLFDYKTDRLERFKERAEEEMLNKYKGQLLLYKSALESILDKPVTAVYLCLLDNGSVAEVK